MSATYIKEFSQFLCELGVSSPCFTLTSEFKRFLIDKIGLDKLKADELSVKMTRTLEEVFDEMQQYFETAGIDSPYRRVPSGLIQSFMHRKYVSNINWQDYKSILDMVVSANPFQLLFLGGLALVADGNYMVIVNDKAGDGGVDLISKDKDSSFNCRVVLAQIKKSTSTIGKQTVIYEDANYWDEIIRKNKLDEHYKTIGVSSNSIAVEIVYHFMTNQELSRSALSYAKSRAIKVRLARELAGAISKRFSYDSVESALKKYNKPLIQGKNLVLLV